MKLEELKMKLGCTVLSVRKGVYTAKWSYFYRHGRTPEGLAEVVLAKFPNASIIEKGDHWHGFVGGARAGSAQDSYMWVRFTL